MKAKDYLLLLVMSIVSVACSSDLDQFEEKESEKQMASNEYLIPLSEAIANGEAMYNMVYQKGNTRSARKIKDFSFLKLNNATRGDADDDNGYYIVNYENDGGFALLSADKRRTEVLGISNKGSLYATDTIDNQGLSWYMNVYLPTAGFTPGVLPKDTTDTGLTSNITTTFCEPLLKGVLTSFHQRAPYNKYCFTDEGDQALVGCGPLAVGTLVAYHKYPTKIEGYTFDWDVMYNKKDHDLWSRLFKIMGNPEYLGVQYLWYGTKTPEEDYQDRIIRTFNRLGYTHIKANSWQDDMNEDLRKNRPVLASGNLYSRGKHIWVIDGGYNFTHTESDGVVSNITSTDYYHCVWGWGPTDAESYFAIDNKSSATFNIICLTTNVYK